MEGVCEYRIQVSRNQKPEPGSGYIPEQTSINTPVSIKVTNTSRMIASRYMTQYKESSIKEIWFNTPRIIREAKKIF